MANLLLLKRRIRAALNVSKTTKAMQMIATSKLKKAQNAALDSRPYVEKLTTISQNLSLKLESENRHKYLEKKDAKNCLLIVLSPDKGLCGGLVTNLTRELINFDSNNKDTHYIAIGKKIESTIANLKLNLIASFKFGTTSPSFDVVYPITKIIDDYLNTQKVDTVKVLSTHFTSVFSQLPKVTTVIPIEFPKEEESVFSETLFEPSVNEILPVLLKHYLEMSIFHLLLENYASEQGARMIAMQNATENAIEIAYDLQLEYNKIRQEKITNEILDIGGASFSSL